MTNEEELASNDEVADALTTEAVEDALRRAAPGADELNEQLKEVFALSDVSATLRLR